MLGNVNLYAQNYPDQQIVLSRTDFVTNYIQEKEGVEINHNTGEVTLNSNNTKGYIITKPISFDKPFNHGLPSWNGYTSENRNSYFMVFMKFKVDGVWTDKWITVGYWNSNWGVDGLYHSYGSTTFNGGKVAIDEVKLTTYITDIQFKVFLYRKDNTIESPEIHQLAFFASDSRTTDDADITAIVADKPEEFKNPLKKEDFVYQYDIKTKLNGKEIGPSICSPTSTSMILFSLGVENNGDPKGFVSDFALKNYDKKWRLFGVWPRTVQNGSNYGFNGTVTKYRNWSDAREVLANGGRIAMSLGRPLYKGHLVMFAGIDANGKPRINNPARRNTGYNQLANPTDLAKSWFNKGGISYTFYPDERCKFKSTNSDVYISNVSFYNNETKTTIYQNITENNNGSANFTSDVISIDLSKKYSIELDNNTDDIAKLEINNDVKNANWKVWIDFNENGFYDKTNELVYSANDVAYNKNNFTLPEETTEGNYNMLVIMDNSKTLTGVCGEYEGEAEYYTINISNSTLSADKETAITLLAYPNPVSEMLNIRTNEKVNSISVFSINGTLVYSNNYPTKELTVNTQNWTSGVYFVQYLADGKSQIQKIVKL